MKAKRKTLPRLQEDLLLVLEAEVHQVALEEALLRVLEAEVHQAVLGEVLLQVLEVEVRRVEPEEAHQFQDQETLSRLTPRQMIQTLAKRNES